MKSLKVSFISFAMALFVAVFSLTAQIPQALAANGASLPSFEDLAEQLLPTVVNISTVTKLDVSKNRQIIPMLPKGSPFEDFFKDFYGQPEQDEDGEPVEQKTSAVGSGFVIDAEKGYIVTNAHVIKDADEVKVVIDNNKSLEAEVIGSDSKTDIALLKVKETKDLTAVNWGDSDKLRVGSWVLAIGNPFGLGGSVTAGIVSARHRDINAGPYDEYIQTDASINKGNSGGPMFNTKGEVVGINTAIFSPTGGSVGIGFAVPSNMAKNVISQLIKYGKTKRGWLGVRIQEVTPEIAENLNLDKAQGAMIASVNPKGPAAKAGIKTGDIVLKFDGHEVEEMRRLPKIVADTEVGKKVRVVIWRKGKTKVLSVDLGQLEKAEEEGLVASKDVPKEKVKSDDVEIPELDITVAELNDNLKDLYNIDEGKSGIIVTKVKRGGIASEKGLRAGDLITEVNQQEIKSPKELAKLLKQEIKAKKSSILLFVSRGDDVRFIALKLKK